MAIGCISQRVFLQAVLVRFQEVMIVPEVVLDRAQSPAENITKMYATSPFDS